MLLLERGVGMRGAAERIGGAAVGRIGRSVHAGEVGIRTGAWGTRTMAGGPMRWNSWERRGGEGGEGSQGKSKDSPDANGRVRKWEFEDILRTIESPSSSTSATIIDVREPHEFSSNSIPTAHNLPIVSHPDALFLPTDEFRERFAFPKPPVDKEVVFFCKAGVRSQSAVAFARKAGYTNIGEYRGSWIDWVKRGGPVTKTPPPPGGGREEKKSILETRQTQGTEGSGEEDLGQQSGR